MQPSQRLNEQKQQKVTEDYNKCEEKVKLYNEGKLPPEPGCDAAQSLESRITQILNGIRDAAGKVRLSLPKSKNSNNKDCHLAFNHCFPITKQA